MAEQFSLDLLGQHILAVRGDIAAMKTDLAAIRDRLDHHQDELDVVLGLAMRATGERVAWASVRPAQEAGGADRGAGERGAVTGRRQASLRSYQLTSSVSSTTSGTI